MRPTDIAAEQALLVLDLDMPTMNGMEVLDRVRSTTATAALFTARVKAALRRAGT